MHRLQYNAGETSKITSDSLVAVTELTGKDGTKTDISIDKPIPNPPENTL
ncbi:hypothetical protein [Paenibacillus kribbensis]|nr:hypothetical protein [Paenibacillus kribbensis]